MGYGRGKLDVAHPLAAHPKVSYFDAAAVTDHALVADGLELATIALPFLGCAEDALTEQAILLRSQGARRLRFQVEELGEQESSEFLSLTAASRR